MRYATNIFAFFMFATSGHAEDHSELRVTILREAALEAGFVRAEDTHVPVSAEMVAAGKLIFQSRKLSLENEIACASCHLDKFGSADGLPNAIGTQGRGDGTARLRNGGDIIPRNALPFWGRGGKGFDKFFWDGRVEVSGEGVTSQFAGDEPSSDPLEVAVHLPPVEIGEMVLDIDSNQKLQQENVSAANNVYQELAKRLRNDELIGPALAIASRKDRSELQYIDVARSLAGFIRHNFRVKPTKFHRFVFDGAELAPTEVAGGILFYGKGRCATCHNGPYFSDMDFHSIPFVQSGFGRNGFGVDYGRYNATQDVDDLYKFRTPPLYNVSKTAPYSHSGAYYRIEDAIRAHVDPLALLDVSTLSASGRTDFYASLKRWVQEPIFGLQLADDEVVALVAFLGTLNYESDSAIVETD